jgi:RNA polymerase sigma factor (sigma-70 family)
MSVLTNETCLEGIKNNDPVVLKQMYQDFFPAIYHYIVTHHGTKEDAKDIFADVLEALFRKVNGDNFTLTCKMKTFLTAIGAHLWMKKNRKKIFDARVTFDDPMVLRYVSEMEESLEHTEQYALYREKFAALKEDCQEVLRLGIQEGRNHVEVMEEMGYTYDYSRKKRANCLKALLELIKSDARYKELC